MIHFVIMAQDKIKMHDSASHTTEKDENTELLKEKLLKVNSVLAAHQIALWEININTLECTFTQEYFESLGLDKVASVIRIWKSSVALCIPMISIWCRWKAFKRNWMALMSPMSYGCVA